MLQEFMASAGKWSITGSVAVGDGLSYIRVLIARKARSIERDQGGHTLQAAYPAARLLFVGDAGSNHIRRFLQAAEMHASQVFSDDSQGK